MNEVKSFSQELSDLKEKNKLLAEKLQYWKQISSRREDEVLELRREINELRMQLIKYRYADGDIEKSLIKGVEDLGKTTLGQLVQVSTTVAKMIETIQTCINKKKDLKSSEKNKTPKSNKINRVNPMVGGYSINKPVIMLRRADIADHIHAPQAVPPQQLLPINFPMDESNDLQSEESYESDNRLSLSAIEEQSENIEDSRFWNPSVVLERAQTPHTYTNDSQSRPSAPILDPGEGPSWFLDNSSTQTSTPEVSRFRWPFRKGSPQVHQSCYQQAERNGPDSTTLDADSSDSKFVTKRKPSSIRSEADEDDDSYTFSENELDTEPPAIRRRLSKSKSEVIRREAVVLVSKIDLNKPKPTPSPRGSTHQSEAIHFDDSDSQNRSKRRGATKKSYKEAPLNTKLRR